jgi:hypothetical protein
LSDRDLFLDDEFSDTELLPASTEAWVREQLTAIAAFSERHELPGGGWNDVYVRPEAPRQAADLQIPLAAAVKALAGRLPRLQRVLAGSISNPVPARGAIAFGPSPLSAIVLTTPEGQHEVHLLEVFLRGAADETAAVLAALGELPSPEPLLMVDWAARLIVHLDRPEAIAGYAGRHV